MGRSIEESDELAERLAAETPRLVRLATRLVRNPAEAEDLVGETVIIAWRARSKLRDPAALPAWLRRSLVNA